MRSGKGGDWEALWNNILASQWSLTFEVRKRWQRTDDRWQESEKSQWSLTFEVRKSSQLDVALAAYLGSQWSLTFEVRKRSVTRQPMASLLASQWSLTFEVRKRSHRPCLGLLLGQGRNGA